MMFDKLDLRKTGFTLIELMLAMTFISMLMIAIAITTIQVTHMYSKGLTIKAVNQAGRDLSDSIKRDAQSLGGGGNVFVPPSAASSGLGRLCLGERSYVWNEAAALRGGATGPAIRYTVPIGIGDQIVMARVIDVDRSYCVQNAFGQYRSDIAAVDALEMVQSKLNDLAVYAVSFDPLLSGAPTTQLYDLQFTLGTNESNTIDTVDLSCQPPANVDSNFDFCSINGFELLISVG